MQKIAIIGAHGTGKTQLCRKLWGYCNRMQKPAEMVDEVVRICPLPIHQNQTAATALWIICQQIAFELEAENKNPEFIICDRSVIDPLVYLHCVNPDAVNINVMEFAENYSKTYDKIYLIKPINRKIDEDGYRNTDIAYQFAINAVFQDWLAGRCHFLDASQVFDDDDDGKLCKFITGV